MAENLYVLQYHIYTLALDRYLSLRRPGYRYDRHFGGVFYIFLRGVNPGLGPEFGIFRDLPSPAVMAELRQTLLDRKK
jgi:exodeoxyribonuclease V beta subunit